MDRRNFLKSGVAAAALAVTPRWLFAADGGEANRQRPNILILLSDDLGYGNLGYEGNKVAQTPRLDALAAGNLRLDRCYAAHSLCAPSRTAIMSGRCAYRVGGTGGLGGELSPQETTLSKALHDNGYRTGHFGKWHMWVRPDDPQYGMDEYLYTGNNCGHVNPGYDGAFDGKTKTKPGKIEGDDSEIIVRRSLEFVDRALAPNKPFFASLTFHTVHSPNGSSQRFRDLYKDVKGGKVDYLSDLSAMDYAIGLLLDELKKRGVLDNTLIYFTGDNGYGAGVFPATKIRSEAKHVETISSKGGMGEGAVRVPGIFHWPARWKRPARTATPIAGYDLMPTFLAAAGIENVAHRPFDGENVLPILDGKVQQRGDLCFWSWANEAAPRASYLVRDDYRLWCGPDGQQALQQIGPDNLMKDVEDAAMEKDLGQKLRAWRESVLADNKQALAEAEKAGRKRRK